jgi:hypothetical protein
VTENVDCIVVEEGTWTIDGVKVEAQAYTSQVTDGISGWTGEPQTYGQTYTSPVVLGQVMSENDSNWSVFWCHDGSRLNPPSATTLYTGKMVAEDPSTSRANETVGFIVVEAGHGLIGGVDFEAALGSDSVRGVDNSPPYAYSFNSAFGSAPQVAIVSMAAMDDAKGGWAQIHGPTKATASTLYLSIDESQLDDSERKHGHEQAGYIVFESPLVYP